MLVRSGRLGLFALVALGAAAGSSVSARETRGGSAPPRVEDAGRPEIAVPAPPVAPAPRAKEFDGHSSEPAFSPDGDLLAFASDAGNLAAATTSGRAAFFVYDLEAATLRRIEPAENGEPLVAARRPGVLADGRILVFGNRPYREGDPRPEWDIFAIDPDSGAASALVAGLGGEPPVEDLLNPDVSANGTRVAFETRAGNLVAGDDGESLDVFVLDVASGRVERASVTPDGRTADGVSLDGRLSPDGSMVSFASAASDLVPGDDNGYSDVFVRDLAAGRTVRVSISSTGAQGDWESAPGALLPDGKVVFSSGASTLVSGDTNDSWDIFLHDPETRETRRISVSPDGRQGSDGSAAAAASPDGMVVAFLSFAPDLAPDDADGIDDVMLLELATGAIRRISAPLPGKRHDGHSGRPVFSQNGRFVAFSSEASSLVPGDRNEVADVFLYDRQTGKLRRVSEEPAPE